jgi:Apea-like HEPN
MRRQTKAPTVLYEYTILPYANLSVGPLGRQPQLKIGTFLVWRDTPENWKGFLGIERPNEQLSRYVDREGQPLQTMWIATEEDKRSIAPERWQHLVAVLFYLAWARIPYLVGDRAAAEDFYFEAFAVPEGAPNDSGHVRWSKYGLQYWTNLKIHPAPEVSTHGHAIEMPVTGPATASPFFDPIPGDLFRALEEELGKDQSRLLTALWFFQQSTFRSASRSSFSEDIQNMCTAFEALLNISQKGDSADQVARALLDLFRAQAPSTLDNLAGIPPGDEKSEVLNELWQWTQKLYEIRNAYTHGKIVLDYFQNRRSVWQDAFEIFRLSANRVILKKPERRPSDGSMIEKRVMSVKYFDEVIGLLWDRKRWFPGGTRISSDRITLDDAIHKARALDPGLVQSVPSLGHLRQALFNICTFICLTAEESRQDESDGRKIGAMLQEFRSVYAKCSSPKLDVDAYIRAIAPRLTMWVPPIPIKDSKSLLYELIQAFKNLLSVYTEQTGPILNSLQNTLP